MIGQPQEAMNRTSPYHQTTTSYDSSERRNSTGVTKEEKGADDQVVEPVPYHVGVEPTLNVVPEFSPVYRREGEGFQRLNVLVSVGVPSRRPPTELGDAHGRTLRHHRETTSVPTTAHPTVGCTDGGNVAAATRSERTPTLINTSRHEGPDGERVRAQVKSDLEERMTDWKGHQLEHFGALHLFDTVDVYQSSTVRHFGVYLFDQAVLCTSEERPRARQVPIDPSEDSSSSPTSALPTASTPTRSKRKGKAVMMGNTNNDAKGGLRLKGRIYHRHIRSIIQQDDRLTIQMIDEHLPDFVMVFHSSDQATTWKRRMEALMHDLTVHPDARLPFPHSSDISGRTRSSDADAEGKAEPTAKEEEKEEEDQRTKVGTNGLMSSNSPTARLARLSALSLGEVGSNGTVVRTPHQAAARVHDPLERFTYDETPPLRTTSAVPTLYPHAPIDLVIIVTIPSAETTMMNAQDALKLLAVRSTLSFLVDHLDSYSRISLVVYHAGLRADGGFVARTPLLRPGVPRSHDTLSQFLALLDSSHDTASNLRDFTQDLNQCGTKGERVDTAGALNVGSGVLLGRTSKNPLANIVLVDDCTTGPRRAAMDLVLGRAEAANAPVHCFGVGAAHDPSSLWLIASYTRGTFTYVRQFSDLRACVAGCVGSLLSTALTDVQLRLELPPAAGKSIKARKPRTNSATSYVVSSNEKSVEVHLGTVQYGQVRDVLVELEFDFDAIWNQVHPPTSPEEIRTPNDLPGGGAEEYLAQFGLDPTLLHPGIGADPALGVVNWIEDLIVFSARVTYRLPCAPTTTVQTYPPEGSPPYVFKVEMDGIRSDPFAGLPAPQLAALAHPSVSRRIMQSLTSSLITNGLLVAQSNQQQAYHLLQGNRRMVEQVLVATPGWNGMLPSARLPSQAQAASTSLSSVAMPSSPPSSPLAPSTLRSPPSSSWRRTKVPGAPLPPLGPIPAPPPAPPLIASKSATTPPATIPIPPQPGHRRTIDALVAILEDLEMLLGVLASDLHLGSTSLSSTLTSRTSSNTLSSLTSSTPTAPSTTNAESHRFSGVGVGGTSGAGAGGNGGRFASEGRKVAAQQAMVLRDQRSWTSRTNTEHLMFANDNGPALAMLALQSSDS